MGVCVGGGGDSRTTVSVHSILFYSCNYSSSYYLYLIYFSAHLFVFLVSFSPGIKIRFMELICQI